MGKKPAYPRDGSADNKNRLIKEVETSKGPDLQNKCRAILSEQMTVAYFDLGEEAIQRLYRSTISPRPASAPNKQLVSIWGGSAGKVQSVLEVLSQEYKTTLNVPACGY
jgi:hypothetical protein